MPRLSPGDRVGAYTIARYLAEGGIGEVYVARDAANERDVALKILSQFSPAAAVRFDREVSVLGALDHPGIVKLFDHGQIAGHPYLAMELLAGETLEARLGRGALDPPSAVAVVIQIASALSHAHARGVIHRDLKPGNVFLCAGAIDAVKLLDFGIARHVEDRKVTNTGALLGTPAYMSPEQARGESTIDARSDVFSLGCVFYEALTGRQAFMGEQFVAILAKVLLDEPAPVRELVSPLAPAIDDLVMRMLSKDPSARPRDASEVATVLGSIEMPSGAATSPAPARPRAAISTGEQRLVNVILVRRAQTSAVHETMVATDAADEDNAFRDVADRHRASMVTLADGTLLLWITGHGNVGDQAARAASCVLALAALEPASHIALATGRGETTGPWPVGPVLERAGALLQRANGSGEIAVDELTARLVEPRYEVVDGCLRGVARASSGVRTLLGRATPCVGREKELALLDAAFAECADEATATAMLVIGPPGIGKSRLCHEFVGRLRARREITIAAARTDPVSSGSSLAIVRQLVLDTISRDRADASPAERLRSRLATLGVSEPERVADFLAELIGAPRSGSPSPEMIAARNDLRIMGEWFRRSFLAWIQAEVSIGPMLVVIEDLHWGDNASVAYLDEALRQNAERPLAVIATARPEVASTFPNLWSSNLQTVVLAGLPRRASERLARAVLGDRAHAEDVTRIVERADGNVFYLEELLRTVAEGNTTALPETVLAMAQARLDALEPDMRRILRAGSVFGERFWQHGVEALLGGEQTGALLEMLVRREVLVTATPARFEGEDEFGFRHGLLRDVAYASLLPDEARRAHRLAGRWLETVGERDARILVEHYERGGDAEGAIAALVRAAQAAFWGGDLASARDLAARGVAAGAQGRARGVLQFVLGGVETWAQHWNEAIAAARDAVECLDPREPEWWHACSVVMFASTNIGDRETATAIVQRMLSAPDPTPVTAPYMLAIASTVLGLYQVGAREPMHAVVARVLSHVERHPLSDPSASAWLCMLRATENLFEQPWIGYQLSSQAFDHATAAGDPMGMLSAKLYQGMTLAQLGSHDAARLMQQVIAEGTRAGAAFLASRARVALDRFHCSMREQPEDRSELVALCNSEDLYMRAYGRGVAAFERWRAGDLDEAERIGRSVPSLAVAHWHGVAHWYAKCAIAGVALARGRANEALEILADDTPHVAQFLQSECDLVRADALEALGEHARVDEMIREACARVRAAADEIGDSRLRASFIGEIPADRELFERESRRGG